MKDPLNLSKKQRKLLIEKMRGVENPYIRSLIKQEVISLKEEPKAKIRKCKYCKTIENITKDHKLPKSRGGKNSKDNLQYLCKRCNGVKNDLTDREVRRIYRWFLDIQRLRFENGASPNNLF